MLHYLCLIILLCSCSSQDDSTGLPHKKAEYISRKDKEYKYLITPPERASIDPYPWEKLSSSNFPHITKEFFRCKGSSLNPPHCVKAKDEISRFFDCGGTSKHGLPLKDGKEFIFPILIELLNYIQEKTGKKVVITSGHRCPEHNSYVDPSPENQYSKHTIGAEVSFYVQGIEDSPEKIVQLLLNFYKQKYQDQNEYETFQRYEKNDTNVSTQPWYNKEIFIKIFKKNEGRNFDNRHPYPYISIQVRYDRDSQEKVIYSWDKANRNFMRW